MKKTLSLLALLPALVFAAAEPGKQAPAFEVKDATGKVHKLSDYKDKWVVLEWFNKDCPFVKKHYDSNNMQALQKKYTDSKEIARLIGSKNKQLPEVTWLTVVSSAKGKQGYLTPAEASLLWSTKKMASNAILLDETGIMGQTYGATVTPHIFIINPKQEVVFAGGIDDNDSANPDVIPKSKNFVAATLDAGLKGEKIATNKSTPYGCSIKYQ